MKINFSPIKFKGYDATPLKALYMQGVAHRDIYNIFDDLKKIGEKENFDVFIHSNSQILDNPRNTRINPIEGDMWAQDNKIIRPNSQVLSPRRILSKSYLPDEFAYLTKKELKPTETIFEGGNVFIGKKDNGEEYIITGNKNIILSSMSEFLKAKNSRGFINNNEGARIPTPEEIKEHNLVRIEDWIKQQEIYNKKAIETMAEEFGVKGENIFVIHQPNFHIDMNIRPIGYPYVLVNDPKLSVQNLEGVPNGKALAEITEDYEEIRKEDYGDFEVTIRELEKYGFKPIRIGGIYASGEVNFMNAIVNKHEDGTISYITNSSNCDKEGYSELEAIFEKELREKVPNIKNVHFVRGKKVGEEELNFGNLMMETLLIGNGGIHCLTLEEPDFSKY